jgi:peptidoglycan hydrolase-like protein with peptidoglycan-binding domain
VSATEIRDLASGDLWQDSLQRSRRRRRLAADGRREHNRKKTASLAVSAAVVAAPAWPSVAGGARLLSKADTADGVKPREGRERVLLSFGDRTPAVASLQRKLRILEDGIFGPQTEAAVRAYQKRLRLPVTGDVDVRTWLTLFPNDAIVATSSTGSGGEPGWSAVTTQPAGGAAPAATGPASLAVSTNGGPLTRTSERGAQSPRKAKKKAKAASLLPGLQDPPADSGGEEPTPTEPAVQRPPAGAPGPVGGTPPSSAPVPAPPARPRPRPLAPLAPGGSFNDMIEAMIRAANRIDRARYSYRWGGGHNSRFTGPYDCSGAVSAVLHAAGLLKSPMVSGGFTRWGAPGKGAVTIYANASHVYMSIRGRFFGTSRSNPGGGAGWFNGAPRKGFVVVHVPFERMKPRKRVRTRAHAVVPPRKRAGKLRMPSNGKRWAPVGDSVTGGATMGAPAAPAPPAASPAPVTPAPAPAPAPVAAPVPGAPTGQAPAAPAQPSPAPLRLPIEVKVPHVPVAPATPQVPSSGQGSTPPPPSGSAPSGPAPTAGPAPSAQAPAPAAPGSSGTPAQPSGAPPAASPPAAAPAPSSSEGPVAELGNKAVAGAGEAVEKVTSQPVGTAEGTE